MTTRALTPADRARIEMLVQALDRAGDQFDLVLREGNTARLPDALGLLSRSWAHADELRLQAKAA